MFRSLVGGLVLAGCTLSGFAETVDAPSNARILPMTFATLNEGPADSCGGAKCRQLIAASGMITAETARQFLAFIRDNPVQGATVVLESDGGSVLGRFGTRPRHPPARAFDHGRPRRRAPAQGRRQVRRDQFAGRLPVHVHLRAARRRQAHRAARCPGAGAPDLARRPARRRGGGQLQRRGSGGRAARHRQHRAIHRGDGRRHRAGAAFAQGAAMGADARAQPRRVAAHRSRSRRPGHREAARHQDRGGPEP